MSDWSHAVAGEIEAPPERIWALWADASRWPAWNGGMASARLADGLALGAKARVRFKGSLPMTFRVTELDEPRLFTDEGRLPGAALRHVHRLTPSATATRVEHELSLTGPLAGVWGKLLGARMRAAADEFVDNERRLVAS